MNQNVEYIKLLPSGFPPAWVRQASTEQLFNQWAFSEVRRKFWAHRVRKQCPSLADAKVHNYDLLLRQLLDEIERRADWWNLETLLLLIQNGGMFSWNQA